MTYTEPRAPFKIGVAQMPRRFAMPRSFAMTLVHAPQESQVKKTWGLKSAGFGWVQGVAYGWGLSPRSI